jgi:hypothetical protein
MFEISKPPVRHPADVAARKQLAAAWDNSAMWEAWLDYYTTCEQLGVERDPYTAEISDHLLNLDELLRGGAPGSLQESLEQVAEGHLVPVFDPDGNPVMRDGEQMYTPAYNAEHLEALIFKMVDWLERNPAADQAAAIEYLQGTSPRNPLDDVIYVVRQAGKIRRGKQL